MTLSAEESSFLTNLRLRSLPGSENPPTLEEMKRAIVILRGKRSAAGAANSASGKPKSKAPSAGAVADALSALDSL